MDETTVVSEVNVLSDKGNYFERLFRRLVLRRYHGRPYHYAEIVQPLKLDQMMREMAGQLLMSSTVHTVRDSQPQRTRELVFQIEKNVLCHVDGNYLSVYAPTAGQAQQIATRLARTYQEPIQQTNKQQPRFCLLTFDGRGFETVSVTLKQQFVLSDDAVELHYGSDCVEFDRKLQAALKTQEGGTTILRGDVGTGKTSFIRHLIATMSSTHLFYFVPVEACQFLTCPDMVRFWQAENRSVPELKKVFVMEDAEKLLEKRSGNNRTRVSTLLNIVDGLLGDFLQMHVICTVNCEMEKLDPAIVRPGRLLAFREFTRISPEAAQRIGRTKGMALPEQPDYSLAEIYRQPVIGHIASNDGRQIGFSV